MDNEGEIKRSWQGKSAGGTFGQRALIYLMRIANVKVGYVILYAVIPFYMIFAQKGYRAIYAYFRQRYACTPWRAMCKTYRNHFLFGQTLLDKFALFAGNRTAFRVKIHGQEHFDEAFGSERGCLLASAHMGNFEILGYLMKRGGKVINSVIFGGEAPVMQANRERLFTSAGIRLIPLSENLSHIFALNAAASAGEAISMMCDRVFEGSRSTECHFLGAGAQFPLGAFHIARKYDLNILSVFVVKSGWSSYEVFIRPIGNRAIDQTVNEFVGILEDTVRRNPEQWFNFYPFWQSDAA